jgi:hypothetical protein
MTRIYREISDKAADKKAHLNGYQLTSQKGLVAEEDRDKDQCIENDLLAESQHGEDLRTEILAYLHAPR